MMKLRHSAALAVLLAGTSAFATNGDNMIGVGAQSRAMGGTGIAMAMGAESAIKNPALLAKSKGYEFMFAGTNFKPSVTTTNKAAYAGSSGAFGEVESDANNFMIPAIALSHEISDGLVFGLGAYGTSGLGVDFRGASNNDGLYKMSTALSIMQFIPAIAYSPIDGLSVGASAIIQYGALGISYDRMYTYTDPVMQAMTTQLGGTYTSTSIGSEGTGTSDDLAMGFDIGAAYTMGAITVGINHKTAVEMEYKYQITGASSDFYLQNFTDKLAQPAETGVGVAYEEGGLALTFDYKTIAWSSAAGYEDFKWDDQKVMALGAAYSLGDTTLRVGYNSASSPLGDDALESGNAAAGMSGMPGYSIAAFNLIGFPATVEKHITLGASQQFTKGFGMDVAYTMATENTTSATAYSPGTDGVPGTADDATTGGEFQLETKHSQKAITLAARWSF